MAHLPGFQPQCRDRALRDAGGQAIIAHGQNDTRCRAAAGLDFGDGAAQDVQGRQADGGVARKDHVIRGDPHADHCTRRLGHAGQMQGACGGGQFAQPVRMMRDDARMQHRGDFAHPDRGHIGQNLRRRPHGRHAALAQCDDRGGQPRHLGRGMADIEDGDRDLVAQALEIGQDLGLARFVQRGQRLIGKDQPWRGQQGAADGDALFLAP